MKRIVFSFLILAVSLSVHARNDHPKIRQHESAAADQYIISLSDKGVRHNQAKIQGISQGLAQRFGLKVLTLYDSALVGFLAEVPSESLEALADSPLVAYVEANAPLHYDFTSFSGRTTTVSDPSGQHYLWYLDRLDERYTYQLDNTYGTSCEEGEGALVYVFDNGVDFTHPEFVNQNKQQWDFYDGEPNSTSEDNPCGSVAAGWHGTAVGSLIAGDRLGVARNAELVSLRIHNCGLVGAIYMDIALSALNWLISPNPSGDMRIAPGLRSMPPNPHIGRPAVLNWSGFTLHEDATHQGWYTSPTLTDTMNDLKASGILVVTSADNGQHQGIRDACQYLPNQLAHTPTTDGTLLSVGGTMMSGGADYVWSGSNYGECISIWAPAADIYAARHNGHGVQYAYGSGTSFSAPLVSGVAAVYMAAYRTAYGVWPTPDEIMQGLLNTATYSGPSGGDLILPSGPATQNERGMLNWSVYCRTRPVGHP